MAQFNFPIPEHLDGILGLLNGTNRLRLSLVSPDGTVQGYFATEYGNRHMDRPAGTGAATIEILNGTMDDARVVFSADSAEQAASFLCGCFLGAFHGESLEDIQELVGRLQDRMP